MTWLLVVGTVLVLAILIALPFAYLEWYLKWEAQQTAGASYFARTIGERRALKQRIRRLSRPALPVLRLLAAANRARATMPSFEYEGVHGPTKVASPEIFARARKYQAQREDVFIVTQMRCGTTWMQQIVFQIVTRGQGDLSETGFGHLYNMSPWIDAATAVPMEQAPLVGAPRSRIIKSHLPVDLCPYGPDAKYIYVTRHPVDCFASIVDYNESLLGPLNPPLKTLADWFCSDRMYWRPWPDHVSGWWNWAATRPNVLFVHYEEMTRDFAGTLRRLETFLGCNLTEGERRLVTDKSSFQYMKAHEELFEMAPPTLCSVNGGEYLKKGSARRQQDVTPAIREQIVAYCRTQLRGKGYPIDRFYPDLR
jgi:hypothetical protein